MNELLPTRQLWQAQVIVLHQRPDLQDVIGDELGHIFRMSGHHEMVRCRNRDKRCIRHRAAQNFGASFQGRMSTTAANDEAGDRNT